MGKALCQGVFFLNFGVVVVVVVVAVVVDVAASAAAAVGDIGPISDADRRPSKDIRSSGGQGRLRFISKFLSLSLSLVYCLSFFFTANRRINKCETMPHQYAQGCVEFDRRPIGWVVQANDVIENQS